MCAIIICRLSITCKKSEQKVVFNWLCINLKMDAWYEKIFLEIYVTQSTLEAQLETIEKQKKLFDWIDL